MKDYSALLAQAQALFDGADGAHFNCAQSVFTPFARLAGLDPALALRLATPLGGGIARRGEQCGALMGGVLVIGLLAGRERLEDVAGGDRCIALTRRLIDDFLATQGALRCQDLLGVDISRPEGRAEIKRQRLHETRCRELVKAMVLALMALIEQGELAAPESLAAAARRPVGAPPPRA